MSRDFLDIHDPSDVVLIPYEGRERCGIVLCHKDIGAVHYIETENVSATPDHNFEIAGDVLQRARENDHYDIVGFWHTHPSGKPRPSSMDLEWAPEGYEIHIVCDGKVQAFNIEGELIH